MRFHRLAHKDLLIISLLLVSSQAEDAWTEDLLEGEQVEALCDSSFLQTSLHVAPSEQPTSGKLTRKSHKKDPPVDQAPGAVEELPVMTQPLSFLQSAEEVIETPKAEAYADSITIDEGHFLENPNVLRWGTLLLNHLLIFMIVVKGGLTFNRLILRKRNQASCTSLAPEKTEETTQASLVHQQVKAIQLASAEQVEQLRCSASSGYDCVFSKPASIGRALRFRARIYGPAPGATALIAPLSQDACVLYETSVSKPPEAADDAEPIVHRAARVDFLATLEGMPDIQIIVRGEEVKMFRMRCGQTTETLPLKAVPTNWQSFLDSDSPTNGSAGLRDEQALTFKEDALRIGELVTLVGDLYKDVAGQLMLWPSPKCTDGQTREDSTLQDELQLFDGVHVLVSDEQFAAEHASEDPEP